MINATVSHEIRNPLSSMIGQIYIMNNLLSQLAHAISLFQDVVPAHRKVILQIKEIWQQLQVCGGKIKSAASFIDFFSHDILDYTMLNQKTINFVKNMANFDIRVAIREIIEILEDKLKMKDIRMETDYIGFDGCDLVNSDKKRF
jgi:CheY-like chemotaxis protein